MFLKTHWYVKPAIDKAPPITIEAIVLGRRMLSIMFLNIVAVASSATSIPRTILMQRRGEIPYCPITIEMIVNRNNNTSKVTDMILVFRFLL